MHSSLRAFISKVGTFVLLAVGVAHACIFPVSATAQTAEYPNYPVLALDKAEGIIAIVDEIDFRTPLAFERTLSEVPNASMLMLNSPGGAVHSALSIAARVRNLGMTTVIFEEHECMSACALIFFAGAERLAWGELGVHQISSPDNQGNMVGGQFALADVIDALNEYDVSSEVIGLMLRTPPGDMYVFSPLENRRYGFLNEPQTAATNSNEPSSEVDLSNPKTWRGKVITGALVSSGKKWYASLNADGSTTFQFSSGQRSEGRYYLTETEVCFQLAPNQNYACRRPLVTQSGVRWYDEDGSYQSVVLSVDETSFTAISPQVNLAASVAQRIPPGQCALIVASRRTVEEAREYVLTNIRDRRFLNAFLGRNGWIAISVGTLKPDEVDPVLSNWKANGRIPQDSYCSTGTNYIEVVNLGLQ
ncbi:hypothetical protein MWU54_07055 [Marivita sp. S6314]|uniref:COG3904 family protein n=1 Tax=Marivita sp. S6314 TaxID=2926406 RepID=UPI001FF36771|nr:hypothetical protein [Marivita sp. S6314]MCK0149774.1 hypothetical protein [Marivita sp. S6314]